MKEETFKFSKIIGNLEARSCNEILTDEGKHTTIEIVQWSDDGTFCWTIASFRKTKEGYDLHFCGDRPFDEKVIVLDFWKLITISSKILQELQS